MDRTMDEPYLAVTPCLAPDGRMFYISGLRWERINDRMEPIYVIKSAVSRDGLNWWRDGMTVIEQRFSAECFSRPWAMRIDGALHLWYSYRYPFDYRDGPGSYAIGHAVEKNGQFERLDDFQISTFVLRKDDPFTQWNTRMNAYPALFEAKGKLYMLSNGNSFGKYGFGLAVRNE
jgi:hypothetical protein